MWLLPLDDAKKGMMLWPLYITLPLDFSIYLLHLYPPIPRFSFSHRPQGQTPRIPHTHTHTPPSSGASCLPMTGSCEAEQETHLEDVGTPPLFGLARASSNTHTPTRTHTSWAQTGTQLNLSSLIYDSDTLE